jgi:hypothetical protein
MLDRCAGKQTDHTLLQDGAKLRSLLKSEANTLSFIGTEGDTLIVGFRPSRPILLNSVLALLLCYMFLVYGSVTYLMLMMILKLPITVAAHELSSLAQKLGSWVRIPLASWMPVCAFILFEMSYM